MFQTYKLTTAPNKLQCRLVREDDRTFQARCRSGQHEFGVSAQACAGGHYTIADALALVGGIIDTTPATVRELDEGPVQLRMPFVGESVLPIFHVEQPDDVQPTSEVQEIQEVQLPETIQQSLHEPSGPASPPKDREQSTVPFSEVVKEESEGTFEEKMRRLKEEER